MARAAQKAPTSEKRPPGKGSAKASGKPARPPKQPAEPLQPGPLATPQPSVKAPAPLAKRGTGRSASLDSDVSRANATPAELLAALQAAERRIAELEAKQAHLADRLTWVLDTLETILADEA